METENEIRIIIAGGGTGGHLFPGVAVGKEIEKRYRRSTTLFVTGRRKMASDILTRAGFRQASVSVEGIKGRGWKKGLMVLLKLPYSLFQSMVIIKRFSPQLVLGVGGYSAGPLCLAARILGVPTAIHEQNSFPGLTNRILCRVVDRVFISFEESREHFPGGSLWLTGNPIREEVLEAGCEDEKAGNGFVILIVGGSQGARTINREFVKALDVLKQRGREPMVIHQTGETDYAHVAEEYRRKGLKGDIRPFIKDMAWAYRNADIVVSRAGATTISELAALGKPSILIPYPFAANSHQETNAGMLVQVGGAEVITQKDLSGKGLAEILVKYMDDKTALEKMGAQAKKVGRPYAAKVIVDQLVEMMNR